MPKISLPQTNKVVKLPDRQRLKWIGYSILPRRTEFAKANNLTPSHAGKPEEAAILIPKEKKADGEEVI